MALTIYCKLSYDPERGNVLTPYDFPDFEEFGATEDILKHRIGERLSVFIANEVRAGRPKPKVRTFEELVQFGGYEIGGVEGQYAHSNFDLSFEGV